MWKVVGGVGRQVVTRPCQSRPEAEQWACELIKAGIMPVKIDGVLFEPDGAGQHRVGSDNSGL
jgi:hypothetical protein